MNLKQKVPKEFQEHTLMTNHEVNAESAGPIMNVDDFNVRVAPIMGRSLSTPVSLRPAKSMVRKSCRPKVGGCKSELV
ncbi:MAG: hypothetical protein A2X86_19495 [Bdellovibrionales bacterium GWA2_49_15]|nr:MAG: hypothetical protein A2X86_19495 [Bdellovibrionales bacterium GWA2_49_15]HAZ14417.1 hypothetical protein [Bdellovibrionales bacterium]